MSEFPLEFSPTLGKLAKALASAQGELKDAVKDSVNPHFKSRFASLAAVRAAITPVFSKNNLAVTQLSEPHGDSGVCVVTMLVHESGEWIKSRLYVPVSKKDAQGFGSALSYARRYALAMIANIATDDDDDANEAFRPSPAPRQPEKSANDTTPPVGAVDVTELIHELVTAKSAEELSKASLRVAGVKKNLTAKDFSLLRAAHDETLRRLDSGT